MHQSSFSRAVLFGSLMSFMPVIAAAQDGATIPDIARALLDVAYETGDADEIAAVTKAVKAVFPDYESAIADQTDAHLALIEPAEDPDSEAIAKADGTEAPAPTGGFFAIAPWKGKVQTSAVFSSGNSENSAVGVLLDAARINGDFTHNVNGYFDLGRSAGITNQKRWGAAYQLDYNFGERTYAYGRLSFDEDEFSGFDYRLFAGAGLGHFVAKSDPLTWKVEGGPGFRYSPIDISREIDQDIAFYAASETDWVIRDGVTFEQDFAVTWTSPTTTFVSITALTTEVFENLSTGVSFEYRYETDPPDGRENTDTIARASVIYGF